MSPTSSEPQSQKGSFLKPILYKYSGVIAWPIRSLIIWTDKLRYNSKESNQGFLGILGIILKRCLPLIWVEDSQYFCHSACEFFFMIFFISGVLSLESNGVPWVINKTLKYLPIKKSMKWMTFFLFALCTTEHILWLSDDVFSFLTTHDLLYFNSSGR